MYRPAVNGLLALFLPLTLSLNACTAQSGASGDPLVGSHTREILSGSPSIEVEYLVAGLDSPWGMDFLPDGNLLVTEKSGAVKRVNAADWSVTTLSGVPVSVDPGQGGMLDVAVHPDFADNGLVYLSYTAELDDGTTTRVSRGVLGGDHLSNVETLFTAQPAFDQKRHYGSRLLLNDGYLFFTVGDRGNRQLAQSLETHNGKVIRLHEDGRVPADNPFVATTGAQPEIYSYGHRNPQGLARHPLSGEIWLSEHGPQGGDEINRVLPGTNYGWPLVTYGEEYGGGKIGQGTAAPGMEPPLFHYVPSIATAGIAFYTGDNYTTWEPSLLVAALRDTMVSRVELKGDGLGERHDFLNELKLRVRDIQMGPDGLVYLLAGDRLLRLNPQP